MLGLSFVRKFQNFQKNRKLGRKKSRILHTMLVV
nr:MAG TPA: hypothetical protein [Caudoviricetes sp.]